MSKTIEKLNQLVGKLFIHDQEEERILEYKIENDIVIIISTKQVYRISFGDVNVFLRGWLLVDERLDRTAKNEVVLANNFSQKLKSILLENIEKVKSDKEFIAQARQINQDVNSIIELAKTEIEYHKVVNKL